MKKSLKTKVRGLSKEAWEKLTEWCKASLEDYKANPSKYKGKPRSPKYQKPTRYNLIFDSQRFQVKEGWVWLHKAIRIRIPNMLQGKKIVQVEIIPYWGFFEIVYVFEDDSVSSLIPPSERTLGIDLGLDNLATCTSNCDVMPFVVDGKKLKAINQLYNKVKAKHQSTIEVRNKRKESKTLENVTHKRNSRVNDYLHKVVNKIVSKVLAAQISIVVIGLVTGAFNGINLGKKTNQNFVNLPLGRLIRMLKYKLELHGVQVITIDEAYTSKASFLDNDTIPEKFVENSHHTFSGKRIKRGLYRSSSGILINADVNGAYNIIRKSNPKFCFESLNQKDGLAGWLHPHRLIID